MRVIFLGTNGWYDTDTGNTTSILLETDEYYIILDAGNGFYKVGQYITSKKPIYLFISHFHLDHISGLHILNKFNFSQGIHVYGQVGTKDILNTIINEPYTVPFDKLPFKVEVHELSEGSHNIPFLVKCKALMHSSKCFGFRFEFQNKVISYCLDTKICENAVELAKNADILITECSLGPGQYSEKWPHLNPEEAAKIANEAKVKKLVLTHFDANIYQTLKEREQAWAHAKKIFSNVVIATDGVQIEV
jgi:ribonuclease BN (tRNA processing enzyme)